MHGLHDAQAGLRMSTCTVHVYACKENGMHRTYIFYIKVVIHVHVHVHTILYRSLVEIYILY